MSRKMTVAKLRNRLEKFADDVEVVVDRDENGWYSLEDVQRATTDDKQDQLCNLISSNEE